MRPLHRMGPRRAPLGVARMLVCIAVMGAPWHASGGGLDLVGVADPAAVSVSGISSGADSECSHSWLCRVISDQPTKTIASLSLASIAEAFTHVRSASQQVGYSDVDVVFLRVHYSSFDFATE